MKKMIAMAVTLFLLAIPAVTVSAGSKTTVSYTADPVYLVTIPTNTLVPFNALEYDYGKIIVEEALVEEDKCIEVRMDSEGFLVNQEDPDSMIPYKILADGSPFTNQRYTKTGEETQLTISIQQEDWNKATGGAYKTAVTFNISYVDKD